MSEQLVVWTQEQRDLIKRTVATDASDSELAMFLHIAAKAGLDPLQKQIHFTKRQGRVTVIAGIDGLQARAGREPDFEGILCGVVCAKDDFEFDATSGAVVKHTYNAFADRGVIKGAWATVKRKGKLPFTAVIKFEEFNQANSPTWRQMPSVMIAKVAKSTALRMAYPEQFSAIYEGAEMDQAGTADNTPEKELNALPPPRARGLDAIPVAKPAPALTEAMPAPEQPMPEVPDEKLKGFDVESLSAEELAERAQQIEAWLAAHKQHAKRTEGQLKLSLLRGEMMKRQEELDRAAVEV